MSSNFRTDFPDDTFLKYYKELQNAEPKNFRPLLNKILNEYPRCPLFYFKSAEFQFNQNDLRKSIETINQTLELYADNLRTNYSYYNKSLIGDLKIQLFLLRLKVLDRLTAPNYEIKEALLELKEESERNPCENLEEITLIVKKYSDKYKLNITKPQLQHKRSLETKIKLAQEVNPEAKEVFELMEISNNQNIMKEEGLPVNVVSMSWFVKWKKFTNFHLLSGEKLDDYSSMELSQDNNENFKHSDEKPGPINQEDILSKEKILVDPDNIKNYCNMILRVGMEENRDFLIVSHKVWKYLFKIYGGQEIKRYIVSVNDDSNLTHVELSLKKVSFEFLIFFLKFIKIFLIVFF